MLNKDIAYRAILTNFSGLFNMESISDESNIWMNKSHELRNGTLQRVSWGEINFNPSIH
jgi:hypothetical protein